MAVRTMLLTISLNLALAMMVFGAAIPRLDDLVARSNYAVESNYLTQAEDGDAVHLSTRALYESAPLSDRSNYVTESNFATEGDGDDGDAPSSQTHPIYKSTSSGPLEKRSNYITESNFATEGDGDDGDASPSQTQPIYKERSNYISDSNHEAKAAAGFHPDLFHFKVSGGSDKPVPTSVFKARSDQISDSGVGAKIASALKPDIFKFRASGKSDGETASS